MYSIKVENTACDREVIYKHREIDEAMELAKSAVIFQCRSVDVFNEETGEIIFNFYNTTNYNFFS